jgi:hypothetical protein
MTAPSLPLTEWLLIELCCIATCHAALAALLRPVRRAPRDDALPRGPARTAPVSVLKPLCGAEPRIMRNLETFCMQAHPSYELLFGVSSASDPAARAVRRLQCAYSHLEIRLVIDATAHASNRKVRNLISQEGVQLAAIGYAHLSREEIYHQLETFYKRSYFRPSKIWEIVREMLVSWEMTRRRLREGVKFFRFLRTQEA